VDIRNSMTVPAPPGEVFDLLLDVERIAPCMPGAQLTGSPDEGTYEGTVKVKVGPITAAYAGTVSFLEVDRDNRRAVLKASGSEQRGGGRAEAKITAEVSGDEDESTVDLTTDLRISGKVAQFGRGALGDISQKLLGQFAANLERDVLGEGGGNGGEQAEAEPPQAEAAGEGEGEGEPEPAPRPRAKAAPARSFDDDAEPEGLNALSLVAGPMAKRFAPVAGALLAGLALGLSLRGRRRRGPEWVPLPYPVPADWWQRAGGPDRPGDR
jgi:carbon monoxide dehydrogenase subunit G